MLPTNEPSSLPVPGLLLDPDGRRLVPTIDYEMAGIGIEDTSTGLMSHLWTCYLDNTEVYVQREGAAPVKVFSRSDITELALAFDQNMRPVIAYRVSTGLVYLRWYDSIAQIYTTTAFGALRNPRLTLDDKREKMEGSSDVIFAYINNANSLCYRQQRDRYEIERVVRAGLDPKVQLRSVGMGNTLRLQFELA